MAYTWHKVTDKEKLEIKEKAKHLLEEFSSKLSQIKIEIEKKESKENLRNENQGNKTNDDFREFMMDNAPFVEDGLIIAEKGAWKK